MKFLENILRNNNQKSKNINYDLIYIVSIIFFLILSILIYLCFYKNPYFKVENYNNKEGFETKKIEDILVGSNRNDLYENTQMNQNCIFSTYKTKFSKDNNLSVVSFWRPILNVNDHYIGDFVNVGEEKYMGKNSNLGWNKLIKGLKINLSLMDDIQKQKITFTEKENKIGSLLGNSVNIIENVPRFGSNSDNLKFLNIGLNLDYDTKKYDDVDNIDDLDGVDSKDTTYNIQNIMTFFNNSGFNTQNIDHGKEYNINFVDEASRSEFHLVKKISRFNGMSLFSLKQSVLKELDTLSKYKTEEQIINYVVETFYNDNFDSEMNLNQEMNEQEVKTPERINELDLYTIKELLNINKNIFFYGQEYKLNGKEDFIHKFNILKLKETFEIKNIRFKFKNNQIKIIHIFIPNDTVVVGTTKLTNKITKINLLKQFGIKKTKDEIVTEFNSYILKLKSFLGFLDSNELKLRLPFRFIQMNYNDKEGICFGDIIDTTPMSEDINQSKLTNLLNSYCRIPTRCCFNTKQTYNDLQPIFTFNIDSQKIQLYKHPYYNLFKVFKEGEDDNLKKMSYIYKIKPCPQKINKYKNLTEKYMTLKNECKRFKSNRNPSPIKKNVMDEKLLDDKKRMLFSNNQKIKDLRSKLIKLKNRTSLQDSIRRTNNRQKLQAYNNRTTENLNLGYERIMNDKNSIDINIEFEKNPKETLLKLATVLQDQLDDKTKKAIEEEIRGKSEQEAIDDLQEIVNDCSDLKNFININEIPCVGCNIAKNN